MLSKNDGFFLLELLLSMSAWFMLSLFFIPLLIDLTNQSRHLEVITKAKQLLYGELQANLNNERSPSSNSLFHNGVEYKINWSESEVCVIVEQHPFVSKTKICAKPE